MLQAAARIFTPLVRLLIAKGVTFQMASEVLKQVYVRVAQKQFADANEATGTKLSLLTGLNRKEIRRLTSEDVEKSVEPMSSFASAVHTMWRTQRRWLDKDGNPKVLPRRSSNHVLSFDDLVKSVTTDHRPRAVFEELMRLGYIDANKEDNIILKQGAFSATPEAADRLLRITETLEDHISASVINVIESEPKFLDRFVFADDMSDASAHELQNFARLEWDTFQDTLMDRAIVLEAGDAAKDVPNRTRIRVGMYFYSEDVTKTDIQEMNKS